MLPILVSSGEEDSDLSDDAGGNTSEYQPREDDDSETESDASQDEAEPKKSMASLYEDDSFEPEKSDVEFVTPSALRCEKDILRKENESDLDLAKRRKEARVLSCVNLPTSLTAAKLKEHQQNSKLPKHTMCPEPHMRCYTFDYPELLGRVPRMVLSTALLKLGIAPHLHWFIRKLCDAYRVAPLQITPNGYRSIVGLYILYDILGFPKLTLEDVRYFFTLKHSGQDYGYFYFSLWPSHYNKGFKVNNPSNMGTWKSPYYYIFSVPRIRTAFNPKPDFLSQVNLQGQALENAQKVFELSEDMKDFRKLINTENLQRCGFLPRGGHCTPPREEKKSKKKSVSRSRKSKPIPTDVEGDLRGVKDKICLAIANEFQEIKTQLSHEKIRISHKFHIPLFDQIIGHVSLYALNELFRQYELAASGVSSMCKDNFTSSMGLPCKHKIRVDGYQSLQLVDIHPQWRLDIRSFTCNNSGNDEIGGLLERVYDNYQKMPLSLKKDMQEKITNIADTSTPLTLEPRPHPHKGRPSSSKKRMKKSSTTREPSLFEIVENTRR